MAYDPLRVWSIVLTVYQENNDPMIYDIDTSDESGKLPEFVVGTPAEILDNYRVDVVENVGRPEQVFVDATDIATYLGCSVDTGRRWLENFRKHGLVTQHGEIDREEFYVKLYRPTVENTEEAMTKLYELADERPPAFAPAGEEVTPSEFEQVEGTEATFRYRENPDVTVDVSKPEEGTIKESVLQQLQDHGLVPSSPNNFTYQLRDAAGLT